MSSLTGSPIIIVVMGVSGCGKSTVAQGVADSLSLPYLDADDLHPAENVAKMSRGQPLTDEDRAPWLATVRKRAEERCAASGGVVVACSSLKKRYRDVLRGFGSSNPPGPDAPRTYFVFIDGDREVILDRMNRRQGHFMKSSMLDSQLATLERPGPPEENIVVVRLEDPIDIQVKTATEGLKKLQHLVPTSTFGFIGELVSWIWAWPWKVLS